MLLAQQEKALLYVCVSGGRRRGKGRRGEERSVWWMDVLLWKERECESGGGENECTVVGELKERKGKGGSEGGVVVK